MHQEAVCASMYIGRELPTPTPINHHDQILWWHSLLLCAVQMIYCVPGTW